jgi:hypothetical protein
MISPPPQFTIQEPNSKTASVAQSEDGQALFREWKRRDESTRGSWLLSETERELFDDLRQILEEASHENWDGFDAVAITEETIQNAAQFIMAFPPSLCRPELGASPRGDISFDWARSSNRVVSAAISHDGKISYAWVNGSEHGHGGYVFAGFFDPAMYQRIQEVLG